MKFGCVVLLGLASLYGQTCAPVGILPSGTVRGALDDASCRLSDGSVYSAYRVDIPARGQIRIDLSTGTDFLLILRDSSGTKIESGIAIRRSIETGSYTLLVDGRTAGQVGAFSLQMRFTTESGVICTRFPSLGLNQAIDGILGSSGCLLPDGTMYEGYFITTMGAGTLTVSLSGSNFTPAVTVRGVGGSAIATGTGSVTVPVDRDSQYQVVVYSSDAVGAYRIAASFEPAETETCRPSKTLADPGPDSGVISIDSCTTVLQSSGDLVFYNYYTLQVPAAGLAGIQVSSSDFTPSIALLDEAGNLLAADAGGGANGAAGIRMQLMPGSYTVQVSSSIPSGGAYGLDYQFTAGTPQGCPSTPLNAGDSAADMLSISSCRTSLGLTSQYAVTLPAFGALDVGLSSNAVVSRIAIRDAKDNLLVMNEDFQGLGLTRVTADLPAGSYYVLAAAVSGAGFYQLTSQFNAKDPPSCGFVPKLEINTGYVARLGSGSCRDGGGQPVDYFDFTLAEDSMIAAVMISNEVDGYLSILDNTGAVLRSDDNSYGFEDPLILQYLPAGSYRLAARAASSTVGGYYRLDLLAATGPRPTLCSPRGTLALGGSLEGAISFSSCAYPDATFADIYSFQLAADTSVDVRLISKDFDAALVLLDAKGNTLDRDDDGGGGTNARITHMLASGTYYVVAKTATDYTAAGAYSLSLAQLQ